MIARPKMSGQRPRHEVLKSCSPFFLSQVKGVALFDEVDVPVVAVVENMGHYALPATVAADEAAAFAAKYGLGDAARDDLARRLATPRRLFGDPGQRRKLMDMWGLKTVYTLPLVQQLAKLGDAGAPVCAPRPPEPLSAEADAARRTFADLVDGVLAELDDLDATAKPSVSFDGTRILATYAGETHEMTPRALRDACRCARCVDETTGALTPSFVPPDIAPVSLKTTGNYALAVSWSDGHQSLLPFRSFVPNYPNYAPPAGDDDDAEPRGAPP